MTKFVILVIIAVLHRHNDSNNHKNNTNCENNNGYDNIKHTNSRSGIERTWTFKKKMLRLDSLKKKNSHT